jgi:hypothetical protein
VVWYIQFRSWNNPYELLRLRNQWSSGVTLMHRCFCQIFPPPSIFISDLYMFPVLSLGLSLMNSRLKRLSWWEFSRIPNKVLPPARLPRALILSTLNIWSFPFQYLPNVLTSRQGNSEEVRTFLEKNCSSFDFWISPD